MKNFLRSLAVFLLLVCSFLSFPMNAHADSMPSRGDIVVLYIQNSTDSTINPTVKINGTGSDYLNNLFGVIAPHSRTFAKIDTALRGKDITLEIQLSDGSSYKSPVISTGADVLAYELDVPSGNFKKLTDINSEWYGFILRLLLTIGVELLVMLAFKLRAYLPVVLVNLFTQSALGLVYYLCYSPLLSGFSAISFYFFVACCEIAIVFIEFGLYCAFIRNTGKVKLLLYSLAANAASFAAGGLLLLIPPF